MAEWRWLHNKENGEAPHGALFLSDGVRAEITGLITRADPKNYWQPSAETIVCAEDQKKIETGYEINVFTAKLVDTKERKEPVRGYGIRVLLPLRMATSQGKQAKACAETCGRLAVIAKRAIETARASGELQFVDPEPGEIEIADTETTDSASADLLAQQREQIRKDLVGGQPQTEGGTIKKQTHRDAVATKMGDDWKSRAAGEDADADDTVEVTVAVPVETPPDTNVIDAMPENAGENEDDGDANARWFDENFGG